MEHGWGKFQIGNACSLTEKEIYSCLCVDDIKTGWKEAEHQSNMKILMKDVDVGEPTSFLNHVYLGCTQRECQTSKDIVDNDRHMFDSKNFQFQRNRMRIFPHGPLTWKVMQRNAWNDVANWRTKQLDNYTKSQLQTLTPTNSRKKKWDQLENYLLFAHRLF